MIVTFKPDKKILNQIQASLPKNNVLIVNNNEGKKVGYGGGANEGIKSALKDGAEWVVVMNQDLKITKEAVDEFSKKLEATAPGIAGPFVGRLDQKRWTTILENDKDRHASLAMTDSSYISGSFMAIHRKVFEKIGLFYEPYFMYYEDADICIRAKNAGFSLTQIKVKGISHEESTSLGRGSVAHEYYLARNHLLFVERNATTVVKIHEILRIPKTLYEYNKNKNYGALKGMRDYAIRKFGEFKE